MPEVGFAFNRAIITDLLRDELGFTGVVLTDFTVVTDGTMFGRPSIGRAWGVEHLSYRDRVKALVEAGVDQVGGEYCTELLVDLVHDGAIPESRIDESVLRLLIVKFQLGLFEDPYVDVDAADRLVGREEFVRAGRLAQSRSVTVLTNGPSTFDRLRAGRARDRSSAPVIPLSLPEQAPVYVSGLDADRVRARGLTVVDDPQDAALALVRLRAPFTHRDEYALEAFFHAGTLAFAKDLEDEVVAVAETVPTIVDVYLDRPALLNRIAGAAAAVTANWGTSDDAWLDVVLGVVEPAGRLPIEVPSSEQAVDTALADVPAGTLDPLFPLGHAAS